MRKKVKIPVWMIWLAGVLFLGLAGGNGWFLWQRYDAWRVVEVVDGDTFRIKSGEKIRMSGIDAPEMDECLGNEAKQKLTELVAGKVIRFEEKGWDRYNRRMGTVKIGGKNVAEIMLAAGLGQYEWADNIEAEILKKARDGAQKNKMGIWSANCGYDPEVTNEACRIKGNSRHGTGKIYTLPGCPNYDQIVIEPEMGDKYFCSEAEAVEEGYVKAGNCD